MTKYCELERNWLVPSARGVRGCRRGFTLVELLVVIVIISIILSFVLLAANDAARRAEERATQSLITKLEGGLNDRIDSLMQSRPDPNLAHAYMAAVWNNSNPVFAQANFNAGMTLKLSDRAQVFAWYDYLKRELPDVFFLQSDKNYPINFAAQPYTFGTTDSRLGTAALSYGPYMLPLGNSVSSSYIVDQSSNFGDDPPDPLNFPGGFPLLGLSGAGIFGASYGNAAGLFKNLPGIQPAGFDGVDNNQNNLVDEITEGAWNATLVRTNHLHVTARAETLYAILVEGVGPLGSVFSRDDFTDREVMDTDGDGLPEFVDAWGQPLQFFRWPVLYHSDLQRGQVILADPILQNNVTAFDLAPPYQSYEPASSTANATSVFQERERNTLDPNQQLTAPQWWSQTGVLGQAAANSWGPYTGLSQASSLSASGGVQAFESFFHRLTEPVPLGSNSSALYWDRSGNYARRAFYTKFLILSGGRDRQPGVFLYSDADMTKMGDGAAQYLIANENNALPFGLDVFGSATGIAGFTGTATYPAGTGGTPNFLSVPSLDPTRPSSYDLQQSAKDDISNHNLQSVSAIGGSG